ncbi:cell wall hydrolase, partial [Paenibacillus riograndensis]
MTLKSVKTIAAAVLLTSAMVSITACSYNKPGQKPKVNSVTPAGTLSGSYYEKSSFTDRQGKYWIPLKPAAASIGYRMKDDTASGGYAKIGYTDVMYMLHPDSAQVFSLGEKITLPDAPVRRNGQLY